MTVRRLPPLFRRTAPIVAVLLVIQVAGVVSAYHGGRPIGSLLQCDRPNIVPPRCTSVGNNVRHVVYFDTSLSGSMADALRATMAEDYDTTDLTVVEAAELTPVTDVVAFSEDYGDLGAAAWVYCPTDARQGINSEGDRWCLGQELRFNLHPSYAAFFDDDGSRAHVACHELGHTLGLRHWGNPPHSAGPVAATCMNTDTPDGPTDLHEIDRDHINAYHYAAPPPSRRMILTQIPPAPAGPMGDASVAALEAESYASLSDAIQASDAVVLGSVEAVTPGRAFGDPAGSPLHYAEATVRVDELLAGSLPSAHTARLTLELPLFDGPEAIESLRESLAGGELVMLLRNKGRSAADAELPLATQVAEAAYYRLVTFGAVVLDDAGTARAGDVEGGALAALDGLAFADAVARIRSGGR